MRSSERWQKDQLERLAEAADSDRQDRWLVSYADFMTLLFAFFVVMYAISSVNVDKYRVLSSVLEQTFETPARSMDKLQTGEPTLAASPHVVDITNVPGYEDPDPGDATLRTDAATVGAQFAGLVEGGLLEIESNQDWLEISLNGSQSFAPGAAVLTAVAQGALTSLADYLSGFSAPITVEGYTDNVPVDGGTYGSNWLLSSARAANVATFLQNLGLRPERLSAVGYGENHPVRSNATPDGRAANRRVVIVVARRAENARNLNATPFASAFAYVRRDEATGRSRVPDPDLVDGGGQRTPSGGLIFSN
ncbi:MAG: OmpA family protein [Pseudomonadota bacterium]